MHQVLGKKSVYVVDFDTMPVLPITGLTDGESTYNKLLNMLGGSILVNRRQGQGRYAKALTNAIETGVITEPGKYGVHLVPGTDNYEIYKINEK